MECRAVPCRCRGSVVQYLAGVEGVSCSTLQVSLQSLLPFSTFCILCLIELVRACTLPQWLPRQEILLLSLAVHTAHAFVFAGLLLRGCRRGVGLPKRPLFTRCCLQFCSGVRVVVCPCVRACVSDDYGLYLRHGIALPCTHVIVFVPYHSYHTIPFHTIPYHTIPKYHTIPYLGYATVDATYGYGWL